MNKKKVEKIFDLLAESIETPVSELKYNNNFQLLVAVILSAQATDISVNKATTELFKNYITPDDFINLGEDGLKEYIKSIGLFNNKAKNVIKTAIMLKNDFNSIVPNTLEDLMKLPGAGRKTANVILNVAFNQPTMAVDTHVFRVSNRIGLVTAKDVLETEKQLLKIIPKSYGVDAHHYLILHGRYTCKARKPQCDNCVISDLCEKKL
jgi:endonuclease-3